MLLIRYDAETGSDAVNPLTIANALYFNHLSEIDDLEEIAEHLLSLVKNYKKQEAKANNETN